MGRADFANRAMTSYRFTFCEGGGSANFDTALSAQSNGCGTYYVCNDDFCGLQSQIDFTAPFSGEFVVVVDGFGSAAGNYVLAYRGPRAPSPADDSASGSVKALFPLDRRRQFRRPGRSRRKATTVRQASPASLVWMGFHCWRAAADLVTIRAASRGALPGSA